jgi:hypothetical protein
MILKTIVTNLTGSTKNLNWCRASIPPYESRTVEGAYPSQCRNKADHASCVAELESGAISLMLLTDLPVQRVTGQGNLSPVQPVNEEAERQTFVPAASDSEDAPPRSPVVEHVDESAPFLQGAKEAAAAEAAKKNGEDRQLGIIANEQEHEGKILDQEPGSNLPPRAAILGDKDNLQKVADHLDGEGGKAIFGEKPSSIVQPSPESQNTAFARRSKAGTEEAVATSVPQAGKTSVEASEGETGGQKTVLGEEGTATATADAPKTGRRSRPQKATAKKKTDGTKRRSRPSASKK